MIVEGTFTFQVRAEDGSDQKFDLTADNFKDVLVLAATRDKRVVILLLDVIKEAICQPTSQE